MGKGRRSGPARDELVRPRGGAYCLEEVVLLINYNVSSGHVYVLIRQVLSAVVPQESFCPLLYPAVSGEGKATLCSRATWQLHEQGKWDLSSTEVLLFPLAVLEMFRHQTCGKPGLVSAAPLTSESSSGSLLLKPSASAQFGVRGKRLLPLLSHGCGFFLFCRDSSYG